MLIENYKEEMRKERERFEKANKDGVELEDFEEIPRWIRVAQRNVM